MSYKSRDVLTVEEDSGNDEGSGAEGNETAIQTVRGEHAHTFRGPERKRFVREGREMVRRKRLTKKQTTEKRKGHISLLTAGLVKPDASTDKEKERLLRRIATKGVVQLFNAVAARQEALTDELEKKMTTKERKEAAERLSGSNFDVFGARSGKKVKQDVNDDEEAIDTSEVKEETDGDMSDYE